MTFEDTPPHNIDGVTEYTEDYLPRSLQATLRAYDFEELVAFIKSVTDTTDEHVVVGARFGPRDTKVRATWFDRKFADAPCVHDCGCIYDNPAICAARPGN